MNTGEKTPGISRNTGYTNHIIAFYNMFDINITIEQSVI